MSDSVYAVLAYIARYWFALLAVVIIWRAIQWIRKDVDHKARVLRKLPDAGYIGEWAIVASDASSAPAGQVMHAPRDGWIGSARACDVRLKDAGVPARAARFYLQPDGLHLLPQRRDTILVDGESVQREAVLRHGATLTVGGVTMQLRLFAGVLLRGESTTSSQPGAQHRRRRREAPEPEPEYELLDEDNDTDLEEDTINMEEIPYGDLEPDAQADASPHSELPQPTLTVSRRRIRRR